MSYLKKIDHANRDLAVFPGGVVEGANVRTPCGPRRIEMVRPGDLIVTRDNGLQPVRMIWKREVTAEQMRIDPDQAPIRLKPRAVGPMMPQRDVAVSAAHRVLVPGYRLQGVEKTNCALLAASELAGSSDAIYVDRGQEVVRYFTLVFDSHQVFSCNGLPVEGFLPSPRNIAALDPALRDDLMRQFPELKGSKNEFPAPQYKIAEGAHYVPDQA